MNAEEAPLTDWTLLIMTTRILFPAAGLLALVATAAAQAPIWVLNPASDAIYSGGNVGIGIDSPQHRLQIAGGPVWTSNSWLGAMGIENGAAIAWPANTAGQRFGMGHTNGGFFLFRTASDLGTKAAPAITDFVVNDAGLVGIGTFAPQHRLQVAGGPVWTSNSWLGAMALENGAAIAWPTNTAGQRFGMGHTNGGFFLFRTASDLGTKAAPAITDFVVNDAGLVGIGTFAPAAKLHLFDRVSVSQRIETAGATNAWARLEFVNGNGQWNVGTSRTFQGDAFYFARQGSSDLAVLIHPAGDVFVNRNLSARSVTVRGGADVAEPFLMDEPELAKGSVVVIDEEHPGRLKCSTSAYDTRVAGIVSGANGIHPGISLRQEGALDDGQDVALSGRVYVLADASTGAIRPGDLLTTSNLRGHAMKASDASRAPGAVIGKAMSSLREGTGLVLVLVTLQ